MSDGNDFSSMGTEPVTLSVGNDEPTVETTTNDDVQVPTIDDNTPVQTQTEESFWNGNPNELPAEVQPIYKNLQSDYTRKSQEIAAHRAKIEAFDRFEQNPVAELMRLAQVYGLNIQHPGQQGQQEQTEWNPQTWDDVYKKFETSVLERVGQQFKPVVENVQVQTQERILQELNKIDPNWKNYESQMMDNLKKHPSLVSDIGTLYRISVPVEVLKGQATKQVINQMNNKAKQALTTPSSTTNTSVADTQVNSFDDAVRAAKQMLSKRK